MKQAEKRTNGRQGFVTKGDLQRARLVTMADLRDSIMLSRQTIWRMRRAGRFPQPIQIGRRLLWSEHKLWTWLNRQRTYGGR